MGQAALCLLALLGHFALWIGLFNRLHSFAWADSLRELLEKLILAGLLGGPALAVIALRVDPEAFYAPLAVIRAHPAAAAYFWSCSVLAVAIIALWGRRKFRRRPRELVGNHREVVHVDRQLGRLPCSDRRTRFWARLPANQILQLEIAEKTIELPQLPVGLDGLRIAHLSDLHFTGRITREFFDFIVQRTNQLQPDLVAITGDIIDHRRCLPWIPDVLGRLQSPLGTYCILGNHELRLGDKVPILEAIRAAGLHYLGGTCSFAIRNGHTILLAGNELPWWGPAADVATAIGRCGSRPALRLLLAHTPDRIPWARRFQFDLMLAGHTHGGQIRLPLIGPLISQSRYGVTYCSGLFSTPPTLLHVSRGLSGCQPLRIHCRPELALLVLQSGRAKRG